MRPEQVLELISGDSKTLPFGQLRSYGDVCFSSGASAIDARSLDGIISFDETLGVMRCMAGVTLKRINEIAMRRGWVLPVMPGTQDITVGGAIANDVHGKNQETQGTFGDHVHGLMLLRTDGQMIVCSREKDADWLKATIGGMGLTGVIYEASINLVPCMGPWMQKQDIAFTGIDQYIALHKDSVDWEHRVGWISDSKSIKGVFTRARHAHNPKAVKKRASISIPNFSGLKLVNGLTMKVFNAAYLKSKSGNQGVELLPFESVLFPLDHLNNWPALYGKKGFFQFQCVVPMKNADSAIELIFSRIQKNHQSYFLNVIKIFGKKESAGIMSFPMEGVTIALDFPNTGEDLMDLLSYLGEIVAGVGGRIYAAKDACMSPRIWRKMYGSQYEIFKKYIDPGMESKFISRVTSNA